MLPDDVQKKTLPLWMCFICNPIVMMNLLTPDQLSCSTRANKETVQAVRTALRPAMEKARDRLWEKIICTSPIVQATFDLNGRMMNGWSIPRPFRSGPCCPEWGRCDHTTASELWQLDAGARFLPCQECPDSYGCRHAKCFGFKDATLKCAKTLDDRDGAATAVRKEIIRKMIRIERPPMKQDRGLLVTMMFSWQPKNAFKFPVHIQRRKFEFMVRDSTVVVHRSHHAWSKWAGEDVLQYTTWEQCRALIDRFVTQAMDWDSNAAVWEWKI